MRIMEAGHTVELEMNIDVAWSKPVKGFNVIAEIPGTDLKDEVVMVGAHFDSWQGGTGATDNATGSAVCMEALRIIQAAGLKPRRTIRIGLWGGEEQGLIGSREYVKEYLAAPKSEDLMATFMGGGNAELDKKPAYDKFSAYFNNDNGTGKVRGVYMQGNENARAWFREWLQAAGDPTAQTLTIENTSGTDHLAFDGVGLPGFQFIQDPVEYDTRTHHSTMDVYDRVQADDVKQGSVMMAIFAYSAAMKDTMFPRKPAPAPAPQRRVTGSN
jgi:Zn-dependent M28 family amino/carboxypeptidase